MRRSHRVLFQSVRFILFSLAAVAAARFFVDALLADGGSPRTFLGFLLITGGLALVWRGYVDLRQAVRRYRG